MNRPLRVLCGILAGAALAALVGLCVSDSFQGFRFTAQHVHYGALALILIGASYVALQVGESRPWAERLKGAALGAAFLMWGVEQLLPPSRIVTIMDFLVISIFVVDLNLIIRDQIRRTKETGA
jgi:hypothetical protein